MEPLNCAGSGPGPGLVMIFNGSITPSLDQKIHLFRGKNAGGSLDTVTCKPIIWNV
jgi:hypothetical protein